MFRDSPRHLRNDRFSTRAFDHGRPGVIAGRSILPVKIAESEYSFFVVISRGKDLGPPVLQLSF